MLNPFGQNGNSVIGTPNKIFKKLDAEFHFTLDVCAVAENTKVENYLKGPCTGRKDCTCGLCTDWGTNMCWMNPPYSKGEIEQWIKKAMDSVEKGAGVVALTHLACSPKWAQEILKSTLLYELRFVYPRIQFDNAGTANARDSMLLIMIPYVRTVDGRILTTTWTWK